MTRSTNNSMATDDPIDVESATAATSNSGEPVVARRPLQQQPKKLLPTLAPAPPPTEASSSIISPPASPTTSTAPTPRKGRKASSASGSAPVSRSAREAARKTNHSRIEKLRREKINDALASLKELVPSDEREGEPPVKKGNNNNEKEFKLEILERTVVYLKKLKTRVHELEKEGPISEFTEPPRAKSHEDLGMSIVEEDEGEDEEDVDLDDDRERDEVVAECPPPPSSNTSSATAPSAPPSRSNSSTSIRLPPISTLFNAQHDRSPYSSYHYQHPISPPNSGRSQPWQPSLPQPPTLHLPSAFPGREDTSAATMLMQFSAERTSLSPVTMSARIRRTSTSEAGGGFQTPASILGMSHIVRDDGVDDLRHKKQRLV